MTIFIKAMSIATIIYAIYVATVDSNYAAGAYYIGLAIVEILSLMLLEIYSIKEFHKNEKDR